MENDEIFRKIGNKDRLVDRVVNEIQELIIDQKLEPGELLPPQRYFAEKMGVSRTVLREAMQVLEVKGLIEVKHGVGTTVCKIGQEQLLAPLSILYQTNGITLDDLNQVRSILEIEIAGIAAKNASVADVQELKQVLKEMVDSQGNPRDFAQYDADFHSMLARLSKNPLLVMLLDSISGLMHNVRVSVSSDSEVLSTVIADHAEIIGFIEANDSKNAKVSMQNHLKHARSIQHLVFHDAPEVSN